MEERKFRPLAKRSEIHPIIQGKFVNSKKARTVEDISKVFAKLVFQEKLSAAIKFLDSESSTDLLNFTQKSLKG